jgi:hypothetical protein
MQRGSSTALARSSNRPYWGTNSLALSWAWRTTRPSAKRDWPTGLPTGPANTPVWSDDTRVWPSNSGHQGGWSSSMRRRRVPFPNAYRAADADRELHCGRWCGSQS